MVALGYGVADKTEYVVLQSYWGDDFGEEGVLKVELSS
jgi:hypothetical protein